MKILGYRLSDEVISPRCFALGGFLVILTLLYASHALAAECPNHCSEERIDAYAALNEGQAVTAARVELATPILADTINAVGYVCDRVLSADYTDLPGAAVWHVNCNGGTLQYTVTVTAKRSVVYAGIVYIGRVDR